MIIAYSRGSQDVNIGDEFFTTMGTKPGSYRVKALHGLEEQDGKVAVSAYSPSGLGGTPVIGCENVRTGEIVDFCGDSVASMIANPESEPHGWDEEEARRRNAAIYQC